MLDKLKGILASQSNHSAIALLVILYLVARMNGVDVIDLGKQFTEFLTVLGGLAAAAKIFIKDAPTVPPGTYVPPTAGDPKP